MTNDESSLLAQGAGVPVKTDDVGLEIDLIDDAVEGPRAEKRRQSQGVQLRSSEANEALKIVSASLRQLDQRRSQKTSHFLV